MNMTVGRLLDTAENAIRSRGYHAVSFRELASDVGIKSASVHYYFPQKNDLVVALVKRYSETMFAELDRRADAAQSPEDRLEIFYDVYRKALVSANQVCLCVMLGAEARGLPVNVSKAVSLFFDANIEWLSCSLDQQLTGKARRAKAATILATLQGGMVIASTLKDQKVFDMILDELRSVYSPKATAK